MNTMSGLKLAHQPHSSVAVADIGNPPSIAALISCAAAPHDGVEAGSEFSITNTARAEGRDASQISEPDRTAAAVTMTDLFFTSASRRRNRFSPLERNNRSRPRPASAPARRRLPAKEAD